MRQALDHPDRRLDLAVASRPVREGLTCLTAATPINHRESLSPRIKSLNYLSHILAKVEGIAAGVDEVIMLDASGYVAEATGMNLFAVTNGTLKTPPASAGILRDVT